MELVNALVLIQKFQIEMNWIPHYNSAVGGKCKKLELFNSKMQNRFEIDMQWALVSSLGL